jgi:hypothetical protein
MAVPIEAHPLKWLIYLVFSRHGESLAGEARRQRPELLNKDWAGAGGRLFFERPRRQAMTRSSRAGAALLNIGGNRLIQRGFLARDLHCSIICCGAGYFGD